MGIFSGGGGGGGAPSGAAGGDLSGTYPNPAVAALAITNAKVSASAAIAKTKLAGLDVVNADVNAAAAIAYSKLALGTSIVNADVAAAAAIALSKLADPTTGKVLGSVASAAAAVFPPGYQLDYVEQTTDLTVTATTSATAQAFLTGNAVTYDGAAVVLTLFIPNYTSSGGILIPALYDGNTDQTLRIGQGGPTTSGWPYMAEYRFTPSAGAHTYSVKLWRATANVTAAGNSTGIFTPAFLRIVKA